MTQQELDAIRGMMREEIRTAVREETRAIMREEIRTAVQEETRAIVKEELKPIHERLDNMQGQINGMQDQINDIKDQLDEMQEDTQITLGAVNALCEWADHVAVVTAVTFPVKKAE